MPMKTHTHRIVDESIFCLNVVVLRANVGSFWSELLAVSKCQKLFHPNIVDSAVRSVRPFLALSDLSKRASENCPLLELLTIE